MTVHCMRRIGLVSMVTALVMMGLATVDQMERQNVQAVYVAAKCARLHEVQPNNIKRLHRVSLAKLDVVGDLILVQPNGRCEVLRNVRVPRNASFSRFYTFEHHFYFAQLPSKNAGRLFFVGRWPLDWWGSGTEIA